jgi:hypothetical protein
MRVVSHEPSFPTPYFQWYHDCYWLRNIPWARFMVTDTQQMISEIIKEKRFVNSVIYHTLGSWHVPDFNPELSWWFPWHLILELSSVQF